MRARTTLMLAMVCGTTGVVSAQEYMKVSYQASVVQAGTTNPGTSFTYDLWPGDGIRLQVNLTLLRNGTSAIGQTTTLNQPPLPNFGTIAGIGSFLYDLYGLHDATGMWYGRSVSGILSTGASTGTVSAGGSLISNIGGSQFLFPGTTANATNPIVGAFVGYWVPNSYSSRWVYFQMRPGSAAPPGQQNSEAIKYGNDPGTGDPQYAFKYLDTDFGLGLDIGIGIPAPSSLAAFGLAGWMTRRRRQPVP